MRRRVRPACGRHGRRGIYLHRLARCRVLRNSPGIFIGHVAGKFEPAGSRARQSNYAQGFI